MNFVILIKKIKGNFSQSLKCFLPKNGNRYERNIPSGFSKISKMIRRHFLSKVLFSGIGGFCAIHIGNEFYPLRNITADISTATGQRRCFNLRDGSTLLLDARSGVDINFGSTVRCIRLLNGALSVKVALDTARPFLVLTEQGKIQTSKASFMVRQQAQRTLVAVHDSCIQIETLNGEKKNVISGKGVRFDSNKIGAPRSEIIAEASWENGSIDAHGRPLVDILESLKPYKIGPLRVSAAAGGLPVFGNYSLDDTDATLNALQHRMPISIHDYGLLGISISVTSSSFKSKVRFRPNSNWKDILRIFYY